MEIFVLSLSSVIYFLQFLLVLYRSIHDFHNQRRLTWSVGFLSLPFLLLSICGIFIHGNSVLGITFDIILGIEVWFISVFSQRNVNRFVTWSPFLIILVVRLIYYLLIIADVISPLSEMQNLLSVLFILILFSIFTSLPVVLRTMRMKLIMKSGTVWESLSLTVDYFYTQLIYFMVFVLFIFILTRMPVELDGIIHILLLSLNVSLFVRYYRDSLFVFSTNYENSIIESMNVSHFDMYGENMDINALYDDIYDRLLTYFETTRPYLNSGLTISDVSKSVFSNRLYLSRAINRRSGRNFCQFVNYYRVMYSMEAFRKDSTLKVSELATLSGFNTITSYTMAFRHFVDETPSEWCRKEVKRLLIQ